MPDKHDRSSKNDGASSMGAKGSSPLKRAEDQAPMDGDNVPTKTVDIWFQSAYRTQLELTSLADMKANIMISVNGLIITGIVATQGLVQFVQQLPRFIPILIMLACVVSMIFAVIAALPKGRANQEALSEQRRGEGNLLYFNNQNSFSEEEFEQAMMQTLQDPEQLQRQMSRHLYNLGCVLARKYWLLKISYSVFLVGLVLAVALSSASVFARLL